MICKKCGTLIPEDSRFCTVCGASVGLSPEPEAPQAPEEEKTPEKEVTLEEKAGEEAPPQEEGQSKPPKAEGDEEQVSAREAASAQSGIQPEGWSHEPVLYQTEEEPEASEEAQEQSGESEPMAEQPKEEVPPSAAAGQEPIYARGLPPRPGQGQPNGAGGAPGTQGRPPYQAPGAPGGYRPGGAPGAAPQPGQPLGEMTLGEWIRIVVLTAIPVVNIVMLFIWAFSSTDRDTKRNWARAQLIVMAVGTAVAIPLTLFLCIMVPAFIIASGQLFM